MAFRFMGYIVQIMAQHLKENEREELPIVYPILFFNGDTLYPYSPDLFDLFGQSKELAKNLLFQPFQLIDLTQIPDATLKLIEQGMSAEQAACITELPLATIKELYETSGHECSF